MSNFLVKFGPMMGKMGKIVETYKFKTKLQIKPGLNNGEVTVESKHVKPHCNTG